MRLRKIHTMFILTMLVLTLTNKGIAQVSVYERNGHSLDSVENIVKEIFCKDSLVYPSAYNNKKIREDLQIIQLVNDFFDSSFKADKIDPYITRLGKGKIQKEVFWNGLIQSDHLVINGTYFHVDLKLESIDNLIVRRKCLLKPNSHGRCGLHGQMIMDFNILRKLVANQLNFLFKIRDYEVLVANDFLMDNVREAAARHDGYKFWIKHADKNLMGRLFENQFDVDSSCCYSYKVPPVFIRLIREQEFGVIKDLLYSPSYFHSVNAMEALEFLASENKIILDDDMKKKIALLIRDDKSNIKLQKSYDVFMVVTGYKELGVIHEQVIRKYQIALR